MTRPHAILITGANGEIGHGLIHHLAEYEPDSRIIALDLRPLAPELAAHCHATIEGNILDRALLEQLVQEHNIGTIYHLAAILSTSAERNPELAHRVNVEGTLNLLQLAAEQGERQGAAVRFLFPSSIAVYGLPSLAVKMEVPPVREEEWTQPTTMYGCNKFYCEHLGRYYARHFRQLATRATSPHLDFRALRFPGLISAHTMPSGGTSDYAPEMLHHAAQGQPYACFVRPDTQLPFMAMPDAVQALLQLAAAPREALSREVYNIGAFAPTAAEFADRTQHAFPGSTITFHPDLQRQAIVDSWPARLDDRAARTDWGWQPAYDLQRAFDEYLVPTIREQYY